MSYRSHHVIFKLVEKYNDDTLKRLIDEKHTLESFTKLPIKERNKLIKNIYSEMNVSIRQLSRVLGIGKTVIERAIK